MTTLTYWFRDKQVLTVENPSIIPVAGDEVVLTHPSPRIYIVHKRRLVQREGEFTVDVYLMGSLL